MADVIMPQMGESIAEGTVTKWLKNVGDRVERDEPLFEISTDKVDAEIPSPAAGVLREIRVAPGTTVPINTVVAVIAEAAASRAPDGRMPAASSAAVAPASRRLRRAPPPPRRHCAERPSALRAALEALLAPAAPSAPPVVFQLDAPDRRPASAPAAPEPDRDDRDELRLSRSSPVVRRIAAEHHVDIREIPGTGIGGRVTKQDILGHIEGQPRRGRRRRRRPRAAASRRHARRRRPRRPRPAAPRPPRRRRPARPEATPSRRGGHASRSCRCPRSASGPPSTWCSRSGPPPT